MCQSPGKLADPPLAIQKVASRSLLEAALEDFLPHTLSGDGFRPRPDIALAVMQLHLVVARHREMGIPLVMLQIGLEDTVQFARPRPGPP